MVQAADEQVCVDAETEGSASKIPKLEKVDPNDLSKFVFKEVLGGDVARKSIFLLIQNPENDENAVLIMDKLAFSEKKESIDEWLGRTRLDLKAANDIYFNYIAYLPDDFNGIKSTIIYPCTEKDIIKYRRKDPFVVYETPEDYKNITLPFALEQVESGRLQWVYNVLDGKSEVDRVIHRDNDAMNGFLLAMDLKWSGEEIDALYLQVIVNRKDLYSVRSLTGEHLPLLKNIRDSVYKVANEKYGLKSSQLKLYFHYQPSFYHLHIHIINLKYDAPASGMTSIPLEEVISNLENWPDYYQKATIMFVKGKTDPLLDKFIAAGRVDV